MNRRSASDGIIVSCLLLVLATDLPGAPSDTGLGTKVAAAVSSIAREKAPSLVGVRSRDLAGEINGAGFLIDPAGTVCTLATFLRGDDLTVIHDGTEYPASLASVDPRTGVAFLKTTICGSAFLRPPSGTLLPDGSPVVGLGFRRDSVSTDLGILRGRISREGENYYPVPLMIASLPGVSPGSPVMDIGGSLAGIVVSESRDGSGIRILPAPALAKLLEDLMRFGRPMPGWIGAVVEEAAVPDGGSRTRIAAVEPGSPAEQAGINAGESLVAVGNRKIDAPQEVLESSFYLSAGDRVRLTLSRGGVLRTVTLQCSPIPGTSSP